MLSDEYSNLDEGFENTESFKWLSENISNYGFIIRYPKGKEDITGYSYEPWHLRYVGKNAAKEINDNQLTDVYKRQNSTKSIASSLFIVEPHNVFSCFFVIYNLWSFYI